MIKINIDDEFVLLNLDTNEEEQYKVVQFTYVYEPDAMCGAYATEAPTRRVITSSGGTISESGALIISTASKLGKASLGKGLGDGISYELESGAIARFKVVKIRNERYKENHLLEEANIVCDNGSHNNIYLLDRLLEEVNIVCDNGYSGLELYKQLQRRGEFPVIAKSYWSKEFCFVVEDIVYGRRGERVLFGTTFNNGKVYQRNKEYDANQVFQIYNGTYKQVIAEQYQYVQKLVFKKDIIDDVGKTAPTKGIWFVNAGGDVIEYSDSMKVDLLKRLKEFRLNRANEEGLPAYCIFWNSTLDNIVNRLPRSLSSFKSIYRCSKTVAKNYGDAIVEIINKFLQDNNIVEVYYGDNY